MHVYVHVNYKNYRLTFHIQLLGYEVDTINSVQFSNHTGTYMIYIATYMV